MRTLKSLTIIATLISASAMAAFKPMECQTNFGEKSFTIQGSTVAFKRDKEDGRSISSVLESATKVTHSGFDKIVYKDGNKHLIHINNVKRFNSNNDFLAVTSPKGHKMTFPINCSLLE